MTRVNINILRISELKWTRIDRFHSDDHHIYYCGQGSLGRNRVALRVNKRIWNAVPGCNLKRTEWSRFVSKTSHSTPQYSKSTPQPLMSKKLKLVLWRNTMLSRTNTKKRCPVHHRGFEWKSRKSRDTQNNRQVWPWSSKWSRAKANRVLSRKHVDHSKHPFPTTQETSLYMDITRWSILKLDYVLCSRRLRSSVQLAKGKRKKKKDLELTVAQITVSLLQNSSLNWGIQGNH